MNKNWIIGISDSVHDQSVALFCDTKPIVMVELERLIREKHGIKAAPKVDFAKDDNLDYFASLRLENTGANITEVDLNLCIDYCLDVAGITRKDIDLFIGSSLHFHRPFPNETVWINHYLGHAANFYSSSFEESAILVLDGYGDSLNDNTYEIGMFAKGKGSKIEVLQRFYGSQSSYYDMANSLGVLYRNASVLTGFGLFGQGKVMGLAAYGDKSLYGVAKHYYHLEQDGSFHLDNKGLFLKLRELLSTKSGDALFNLQSNIATVMQHTLEVIVLHMVAHLIKKTGSNRLCFSGGIAINSVLNNKILQETDVEELFVMPAAGDNGISLGTGLWGAYNLLGLKRDCSGMALTSAALGKSYSDDEILSALTSHPCAKEKFTWTKKEADTIYETAAERISNGEIIGWFRNGSEIGPRALGNRSILADPRRKEMKEIINHRVKHREPFRPFAPSVLLEHLSEYFNTETPEPFMLRVVDCNDKALAQIPAIVHYDGTARIQTVDKRYYPDYHKLISSFYMKSGVPVVLNTSFNDNNEPIVESPTNALDCFLRTGLDALYLENWEVLKQ